MPANYWLLLITLENAFEQKKTKPVFKFNPGLELNDLRTTGPGLFTTDVHSCLEFGQQFSGNNIYSVREKTFSVYYSRTSANSHISTTATFLCPQGGLYRDVQP